MRAIWFENKTAELVERLNPAPRRNEALLRVLVCGVCQTDLELLDGYYGFSGIAGHEFVGLVESAEGRPELIGRRAVASINIGCGRCRWCQSGDPRHCPDRSAVGIKGKDGAFAEYIVMPTSNLYLIDDDLSDEEAAMTEPLAAALAPAEQVHIRPDMAVAVLGDGKLGLLSALALNLFSPGLILFGKHKKRLALASDQGVKTIYFDGAGKEQDRQFDVVVEATGRTDGLEHALRMVKPRGVIAAKTTLHQPSPLDLARLVVNEVRLIGSRCGDFSMALHFMRMKMIDLKPLISALYPMSQFGPALAHAKRPGAGKIMIKPNE